MKLVVNISSIGPRSTGLGYYALQCARTAERMLGAEIVAADGVDGFAGVVLRAPASHALGAGRSAALRRWVWGKLQRDFPGRVMYSPTHHVLRGGSAQILTIHDLIALRYPRQHPTQYWYFRQVLPRELRRTTAVFTVSETTRQDIHDHYGFPLDRIRVVPNGVDRATFHPGAACEACEPFLLVVGAGFPHKNVEELLAHSHAWRDRYRLVIASCRGSYRRQLEGVVSALRLRDRVQFVPYAPLPELVRLYQTCAAFVYPSRWEGFGVPPLEALACGAPVIVSDIPAHREVLGEHARFVRLGDSTAWEAAFADLARGAIGTSLSIESPLERFSWPRSGKALVQHLLDIEPRLGRATHEAPAVSVA